MKTIIYFLILLAISCCDNKKESITKEKAPAPQEMQSTSSVTEPAPQPEKVATSENKESDVNTTDKNKLKTLTQDKIKLEKLVKESSPFIINGIKCYWNLTLLIEEGNDSTTEGKLTLINSETGKELLSDVGYYTLNPNGKENSFNDFEFDLWNKHNIKDLNFDGYKDIMIFNDDGGAHNMPYNVYLYDSKKKLFEYSDVLSGSYLSIDTKNKTLSSFEKSGAADNSTQIIHFGENGKIKFTERITNESIQSKEDGHRVKGTYEYIVNGKVLKKEITDGYLDVDKNGNLLINK